MSKRSLPKPRIFISHSAHEPQASNTLDILVESLKPDFDVLCDKERLIAGQEWRDELFTWMHRAHSAVILFSASALQSDWVRTEASVLTWRRTLDKGNTFKVIPVLLDPVTKENLREKKFSPMQLTALQLVQSNDPAQIAQGVSEGLRHLIKDRPPDTPFEKLERKIAHLLTDIKAAELLNAARAMNADVSEWSESSEYPMLLAGEMLRRGLPEANGALHELADFLGADNTSTLVELISPAWVNLHAASGIPQIATSKDAPRVMWVNGGNAAKFVEYTGTSFVRRACCRSPNFCWPIFIIPNVGGEDDAGYFKSVIRKSIKNKVLRDINAPDSELEIVLTNRERDKEPIFIVFAPPAPATEVLDELRNVFKTLTFFVLTGNQPAGGAQRLPPGIEFLQPELRTGEEEKAYLEYITTKGYFP